MRKVLGCILTGAALCLLFAGCSEKKPAAVEQQAKVLKFAHRNSPTHVHTALVEEFAKKVEEETKGSIKINIYPNNELGDPDQICEQVQLGSIDITLGGVGNLGKFSKKYNSVVLPFLFSSYDNAIKTIQNDFLGWVKADYEEMGFHLLDSVWASGFRHLTTRNTKVETPQDVKGRKIRVPPTQANQSFVLALGAVPETIAFSELYTALKQGVVDGQENPIATIDANQYYEAQKFIALTYHLFDFDILTFNAKTWKSLTPEQQGVIEKLAKEFGEKATKAISSNDETLLKHLESMGMTVTRPDVSSFSALMTPAYQALAANYGDENIQTVLKMAEKNR